jgi:hypothetical protein
MEQPRRENAFQLTLASHFTHIIALITSSREFREMRAARKGGRRSETTGVSDVCDVGVY